MIENRRSRKSGTPLCPRGARPFEGNMYTLHIYLYISLSIYRERERSRLRSNSRSSQMLTIPSRPRGKTQVQVEHIRSVFKMSCLFLRPRPWQFEI